jgi:hypothetical protein
VKSARISQRSIEKAKALNYSEVAEIRVCAERKCGQLLIEAKENGTRTSGHAPMKKVESDAPIPLNLDDLGITRDQSSQWQKLAEIADDKFEEALRLTAERVPGKDNKEARDIEIFQLWLSCHKQEEIAELMGVTQPSINAVLSANGSFRLPIKHGQFSHIDDEEARLDACEAENRGNASHEIDFEVPLYSVWKQQEKSARGGARNAQAICLSSVHRYRL